MDSSSVWLARHITKKILDDRTILLNTLASGGVQDRYQFICGQINIIDKVLQIIKDADPDEMSSDRLIASFNQTKELY